MALWRGSEKTADQVREEIARRYGEQEAGNMILKPIASRYPHGIS